MKTPEHKIDWLPFKLQSVFFSGVIAFPYLIPFGRFLVYLLTEKEKKIKESMKIVGLTESAYFCSWSFHYFVYFTSITFLVTFILK